MLQVLSKGSLFLKNAASITTVFTACPKQRKINNDVKHGHGHKKRIPSTYIEGKDIFIYFHPLIFI